MLKTENYSFSMYKYLRQSKKGSTILNCLLGIFLENDFGPHPPTNFVHDHYFSAKLLLFIFYYFRVRLGPLAFLGRVLRIGQARGPSAAARPG